MGPAARPQERSLVMTLPQHTKGTGVGGNAETPPARCPGPQEVLGSRPGRRRSLCPSVQAAFGIRGVIGGAVIPLILTGITHKRENEKKRERKRKRKRHRAPIPVRPAVGLTGDLRVHPGPGGLWAGWRLAGSGRVSRGALGGVSVHLALGLPLRCSCHTCLCTPTPAPGPLSAYRLLVPLCRPSLSPSPQKSSI